MSSRYDPPSETLRKILRELEGTTTSAPVTDYPSSGTVQKLQEVLDKLPPNPATQATLASVLAALQGKLSVGSADLTASGNINIQNSVPSGAATAGSSVSLDLGDGACALSVQVTGTYTGALSLQGTVNGTNWITIGGTVFFNANTGAAAATIASAAVGIFQAECSGFAQVRVSALAAVTGTAAVTLRASKTTSLVSLDTVPPVSQSGTWTVQPGNTPNTTPWLVANWASTVSGAACSVSINAAIATPNVKASAGNVYGVSVANPNASTVYLQFYNTASTPTRGTSVVWWLAIPANSVLTIPPGTIALANFATGIGAACATTATGASAPGTAPDVVIFFK